MRPALVTIDALPRSVPALVCDNTWNGWLIPFFSYKDAIQILLDLERPPEVDDQSTIRFFEPCTGEWVTCTTITIDGIPLYNVADGWTWEYT